MLTHCPKNNENLRQKTEAVTAGTDATIVSLSGFCLYTVQYVLKQTILSEPVCVCVCVGCVGVCVCVCRIFYSYFHLLLRKQPNWCTVFSLNSKVYPWGVRGEG